jgi:hypothetical protein
MTKLQRIVFSLCALTLLTSSYFIGFGEGKRSGIKATPLPSTVAQSKPSPTPEPYILSDEDKQHMAKLLKKVSKFPHATGEAGCRIYNEHRLKALSLSEVAQGQDGTAFLEIALAFELKMGICKELYQ